MPLISFLFPSCQLLLLSPSPSPVFPCEKCFFWHWQAQVSCTGSAWVQIHQMSSWSAFNGLCVVSAAGAWKNVVCPSPWPTQSSLDGESACSEPLKAPVLGRNLRSSLGEHWVYWKGDSLPWECYLCRNSHTQGTPELHSVLITPLWFLNWIMLLAVGIRHYW